MGNINTFRNAFTIHGIVHGFKYDKKQFFKKGGKVKKSQKFSLGKKEMTVFPEKPELSTNGGDYYFYETPILKDGVKVGVIYETSADFDYCMGSGNFTETVGVDCPELGILLGIAKWHFIDDCDEITVKELLKLNK